MSRGDREPGATYAPGDICWCDFESRGDLPISVGTDRYSLNADAIVLAWAIGDDDVEVVAVEDFSAPLKWADMPRGLRDFFYRATSGTAVFCAHNAGFDRAIWNNATSGFPTMEAWMMIDTRAQAAAAGLPAALDHAARFAGAGHLKSKAGKALIDLFTLPESDATPETHPEEWEAFLDYAADDVDAMRDLFRHTRQLPLSEWKQYWAAEAVNDYGVRIDVPLAKAAAAMAELDQRRSAAELSKLTSNAVTTVNQVQRMTTWMNGVLPAEGRDMLVKRYEEIDVETGEVTRPRKHSLTRDRVIRLIAYLHAQETLTAPLQAVLRLLQIRLYGGSKTPAKFGRMLEQHVDGVIRHQYVFNGASQTGRFSARGIQVHNLARDPLPYEIDAIDALVGGTNAVNFAALGDDTPISRKLSLLIRPALIPAPGHVFVWGDWANIEARLVPWLADDRDADKRLDIFRAVDAGTEKYDIYTRTAAELSGLSLQDAIRPDVRQRGKVVELACGFGGSTNALLSMAASYGIHLDEDVASSFVKQWRDDNPWAPKFWGKHSEHQSFGLWGAINTARERPGKFITAGRVGYIYLPQYLRGSLLCRLPSGRFLTYRCLRWERVEVLDDDDHVIDVKHELMFSRDMGRVKLWPGLACENVVQATAADILRGTLVALDGAASAAWMPVCLHTHDEIVVETAEARADAAAEQLRAVMQAGFDWSDGLPIAADTTTARWYSKSKGSYGL